MILHNAHIIKTCQKSSQLTIRRNVERKHIDHTSDGNGNIRQTLEHGHINDGRLAKGYLLADETRGRDSHGKVQQAKNVKSPGNAEPTVHGLECNAEHRGAYAAPELDDAVGEAEASARGPGKVLCWYAVGDGKEERGTHADKEARRGEQAVKVRRGEAAGDDARDKEQLAEEDALTGAQDGQQPHPQEAEADGQGKGQRAHPGKGRGRGSAARVGFQQGGLQHAPASAEAGEEEVEHGATQDNDPAVLALTHVGERDSGTCWAFDFVIDVGILSCRCLAVGVSLLGCREKLRALALG